MSKAKTIFVMLFIQNHVQIDKSHTLHPLPTVIDLGVLFYDIFSISPYNLSLLIGLNSTHERRSPIIFKAMFVILKNKSEYGNPTAIIT